MTAIRRPLNKRLLVLSVVSLFGLQSCANIDSSSYNPTTWSGSNDVQLVMIDADTYQFAYLN